MRATVISLCLAGVATGTGCLRAQVLRSPYEQVAAGRQPVRTADGRGCTVDADCPGEGAWCSGARYCERESNLP